MTSYRIEYKEIIGSLRAARRRENTNIFASGILWAAALALGIVLLASYHEYLANGDETFRAILAGTIFFSFAAFALLLTYPAINRIMRGKYYYSTPLREEPFFASSRNLSIFGILQNIMKP
jgi:hypothetical protein